MRLNPEVRLHRHTDYFGTEVVEFEISRPHTHLAIDVRARVSTNPPPRPPRSSWEALRDPGYREASLLRHHGIAARYVSGYLFAAESDDAGESVEVDTHAWLEALLPGADGTADPVWIGVDPTNRGLTGETHVKIGHGRHYADVPPIKGVYRGAASATLAASVTMTRLEGTDPAAIARS